ncbi:MAG: hypothetical protein J6A76_03565 [Oscillospiraceae bacterium]|nr:hypothetical protein [Oscillospiraceae bacterium]
MFDVLCGVLLLIVGSIVGYWFGSRTRDHPEIQPMTEEEKRAEREAREQLEKVMKFEGRRGKGERI